MVSLAVRRQKIAVEWKALGLTKLSFLTAEHRVQVLEFVDKTILTPGGGSRFSTWVNSFRKLMLLLAAEMPDKHQLSQVATFLVSCNLARFIEKKRTICLRLIGSLLHKIRHRGMTTGNEKIAFLFTQLKETTMETAIPEAFSLLIKWYLEAVTGKTVSVSSAEVVVPEALVSVGTLEQMRKTLTRIMVCQLCGRSTGTRICQCRKNKTKTKTKTKESLSAVSRIKKKSRVTEEIDEETARLLLALRHAKK